MRPELIYGFFEKKLDFAGYLVLDSIVENRSCGGLRMSTGLTLDEVRNLARNMTLKYSFLGIPMGGAKAGIKVNGLLTPKRRRLIFAESGRILSKFIKSRFFIPGTDMGTSEEDVALLMNTAKGQKDDCQNIKLNKNVEYTGRTMASSARQVIKLRNADVAIEGFGKIGISAARIFSENGANIVAVSTIKGAIQNRNGLDIDKLIGLKNKHGDDLVNVFDEGQKIEKHRLLELPIDLLLPCAESWAINSTNAEKVRAKVICPGANMPLTDQAEEILFKRGIVCVPDFVSNSGTVLGSYMADYIDEKQIKEIINNEFGQMVHNLMKTSQEMNTYLKQVAIEIAIQRFQAMKRSEGKLSRLFLRSVRSLLPEKYQKTIAKPVAKYVFKRKLGRLASFLTVVLV